MLTTKIISYKYKRIYICMDIKSLFPEWSYINLALLELCRDSKAKLAETWMLRRLLARI